MKIGIIGAGNTGGNLTRRLTALGRDVSVANSRGPHTLSAPDRVALPVSGDDEAAKKVVRELLDELGFDTVDNGGQDESWRRQPGTPLYGNVDGVEEIRKALEAEWLA
ncbi:NAD(P)-binding domain-containing protein [Streptomyces sp. NPDC017988]|uniref:NAD(P)-binding domain-containing protein n=1 Tax=Streptomyces sp. NPDC017988 TaxID=3365025 RepID=UPI0037B6A71F